MQERTGPDRSPTQRNAPPAVGLRASGNAPYLLGLLIAIGGLAGGRLGWVWIPFDIFNHFVPHFLVLGTACAIGLVLPRRKALAASLVLLLGLAAIPASARLQSYWSPLPPAPREGPVIRVMAFNTSLENDDWQAVAREVERNDPDIAVLIEFGEEKAPLTAAMTEHYPYQTDCLSQAYCHMAILSKFPFEDTSARTRWRGPPQIVAHYGPELGNLTVVGIHTLRPPHFRSQLRQVDALGIQVAEIGGTRIVLGDFNATPFSRMLSTFAEESGLGRVTWRPSWPASFGPFPQIAIDHIFLSDDLAAMGPAHVGRNAGSDHYPVIADIRLPIAGPLPAREAK